MKLHTKTSIVLAFALVALGMPSTVFGQASETGSIGVTIQNLQITLVEDVALSFGTVQPFGRDGIVTVRTDGATINNGTHNTLAGNPATWSVTGVPGAPFGITLPTNSVTITNNGPGGETMAVTSFTGSGNLSFDPAGNASFNVGATLNVNALQADGTYTGTYNVTVAYN